MNKLEKNSNYTNQAFEHIKHIDENGIEFWYARELQSVLNYIEWRKFENVINKAKKSCKNSDISDLNILSMSTSCQNVLIMQKL